MIKQVFSVQTYWRVVVFYSIDYGFLDAVYKEAHKAHIAKNIINKVIANLKTHKAKAATMSSLRGHVSIVLFSQHLSEADYLNSIVHEAEHIKQAMLKAYHVEDRGEPPAYTIGYLVMKMYEAFRTFL